MRYKWLVILLQQFGFTLIFLGIVLFLLTLLSNDLASLAEFVRYPALKYICRLFSAGYLFKAILIGISLAGGAQILVLLKQRREKGERTSNRKGAGFSRRLSF